MHDENQNIGPSSEIIEPAPMIHREQDIINWGIARNLIGPTGEATKLGQQKKTEEEVRELYDAISRVEFGITEYQEEEAKPDVRDAIGDIIVTLVMQAQMWGLTITECLDAAWDEIKDRKGRMVNGIFVKESNDPSSPTREDGV